MRELDPQVIHRIRETAGKQCTVAEVVRAILLGRNSDISGTFEIVRYFREAFRLTLPQAKPIADWLVYGSNEQSDSELHNLVWPYIEANREVWEQVGKR